MADTLTSIADLVKINDANLSPNESSDLLQDAPLIAVLGAETASNGTTHKYLKETGAPVVGFRAPNAGADISTDADTLVSVDLKFLDAKTVLDEAIVKGQSARRREDIIARKNKRHLRESFAVLERQLFYGTGKDSGGFAGICDNSGYNGLTDEMVLGAGGTAAESGPTMLTSVFFFRAGEDEARVLLGEEGNISIGDTFLAPLVVSSKSLICYWTPISAWAGFAFGSKYSVGRICNIDVSDGTTHGLTDALLSKMFERFPASKRPTHIALNNKAGGTLQRSRTATSDSGKEADWPKDWQGIPLVYTDQIGFNETAVS